MLTFADLRELMKENESITILIIYIFTYFQAKMNSLGFRLLLEKKSNLKISLWAGLR